MFNLNKNIVVRILSIFFFVILWETISRLELVNPLLFPPPSIVWAALLDWFGSGELIEDVKTSYWRMLLGFLIGGISGISLGILTGRNSTINITLSPIVQLLRPLPPVAIIPLIIVWLGIGNTAKVFSIAFAVFFPVWMNTHLGAASIAPIYFWSARTLTGSKLKVITRVLIPATLPSITAGLRTSIAIAFIMVYVAEVAGASAGIGYRISVTHLAYRIDKMVAALVVLAAAGALVDFLFTKLVGFAFPWTKGER